MKIAYVVSDLSFPVLEGLHEQTIALIRELGAAGCDVQLYGFSKCPIDQTKLKSHEGLQFSLSPLRYTGSSLLQSLRFRTIRRNDVDDLVNAILLSGCDVVHLEGIVAGALAARLAGIPTVVSMVDPGSRRNARFARRERRLVRILSYSLAALVFFLVERSYRKLGALWHVVSPDDASFLFRAHRYRNIVDIPIPIPREFLERADAFRGHRYGELVVVLLYADLRQAHLYDAMEALAGDVLQRVSSRRPQVEFRVLGRIAMDSRLREAFGDCRVVDVGWAESHVDSILVSDLVILPDVVGTGLKTRAVQCMAAGRVVFGRPVVFEGIEVSNFDNAVVFESDAALESSLVRLIDDGTARRSIEGRAMSLSRGLFAGISVADRWIRAYRRQIVLAGTKGSTTF